MVTISHAELFAAAIAILADRRREPARPALPSPGSAGVWTPTGGRLSGHDWPRRSGWGPWPLSRGGS